jgi:hypothetical protein
MRCTGGGKGDDGRDGRVGRGIASVTLPIAPVTLPVPVGVSSDMNAAVTPMVR